MVETLVKAFVVHPEAVEVSGGLRSNTVVFDLKVDPQDLGKVIGRQGRTARALRTLVGLAGEKLGKRTLLQILE
jgi:predicted RNA-binding protein YlqC (UPF0109 family)